MGTLTPTLTLTMTLTLRLDLDSLLAQSRANSFLPNTLLPARPCPQFWGSTFWPQRLRRQKRGLRHRWWGLQEGEVSGHGVRSPSWEGRADLGRAGPGQGLGPRMAGQAPLTEAAVLAWEGRPGGGEEMPSLLPAHLRLARSPAASTGNNRGPRGRPSGLLRGRPGREGLLSAFVSDSLAWLSLPEAPGS